MKVKLGTVCTVVSGTTPESDNPAYWDGNINWVTPAELSEDTDIIYETARKITELGVKESSLSPFPAGTVLLSSRAPIGKVAIAGVEMYCNQGFKNLICSDSIFNKYLFWFLKSKNEYLNSLGRGATFKEITKSIVEQIDIPLPSIENQHNISEILDKISSLVSLRKQQISRIEELVKSRFIEMFKNTTYQYKTLISLIIEGAGLSYGIVQPGYDGTGDMGIIRPVDISDGSVCMDSIKYINRKIGDKFRKTELLGEEVLVTVRGTTGNTALTDDRFIGMNVTRGIAVIRYDKSKINPVYLNEYLKSDKSQDFFAQNTRGATLQQINLSDLKLHQILIPPREKQNQFAAFVEQTEKTKSAIKQSLNHLETLKKSLMQEFFA